MDHFELVSEYKPTGDQPQAIKELVEGFKEGNQCQTLLGVTGSGKTFTMANVIQQLNKPTLIIAHNKTLAAQLYGEFKEFFPNNAVEYFVSYYDYYQPEAYVPSSDTYIAKDSAINDEIDKLRHSATAALSERNDVIIVASVSCIYGLGSPIDYKEMVISLRPGMIKDRDEVLKKLVEIQYDRNDMDFKRGTFRVRGDVVEIFPAYSEKIAYRVEFFGDEIDRITEIDTLTGEVLNVIGHVAIFPASHYVVSKENMGRAIGEIEEELEQQIRYFKGEDKLLEADVVINSLHKTLPSLTQTAILHINGKLANRRRIKKYLDMLQSSSPSYIFMASLDACVDFLDGKCEEAFELYVERLQKFREELKPLQHLQILRIEHYDISKVVISTANANITSPELADRLRKEYHLEMEMTGGTYVLAMTTVADTQEGLDRLKSALLEIDDQLEAKTAVSGSIEISGELPRLEQYFTPQEAAEREEDGEAEEIPWKESEGHISLEYAYLYPPGSPVIVPGERISREAVELLCYYETQNLQIEGIQTEGKIKVWKHE